MTTIMSEKEFFNRFVYNPEKDLLGSGGFGSVYRAYDSFEKRYVAIKISQVKDMFGKFTLLNEVELSKSIDDHPNVARYETGLRILHPFPADYAVMAYYEEGNLDWLLRKNHGILQSREYYEIIEGLLEGIAHLHNENVIHRDLKLANILILRTKQGQLRPKIADFGLSRQTEGYDASMSNSAIGLTIAYAAPEQIENKPIRKNVDLWAFAVVTYRLLTGEMPFNAPESTDSTSANLIISQKILNLELPDKLNQIAEPYQSIIRQCWVKDAGQRAQTANELLDILRRKTVPSEKNIEIDEVTQVLTSPQPVKLTGVIPPSVSLPNLAFDDAHKTYLENPSSPQPILKKAINKNLFIGIGALAALIILFFVIKPQNEKGEASFQKDTTEIDNSAFKKAQSVGSLVAYKSYIEQFPNGKNHTAANDSLQQLTLQLKNLLNDADVFIDIKEYEMAADYLKKAALISPNDPSIEKRLLNLKK
jgi:serine/threonine protein kinase